MELDPVSLSLKELMLMDSLALHNLAKKSTGTLTRYHALLGRLLLAIRATGAYLEHGCSGAVHCAVIQLGLPAKQARLLLRVARVLENLPYLRYLANFGDIEWSKLREIIRVATPETEREWAGLCADHTYAEIEKLVARSQSGEVPRGAGLAKGPRTQLCCYIDPDQMAVLERGLQTMCQQAGRVLTMAEAIELLFAEKLADRPVDEEQLKRTRLEATRDLNWSDAINADTECNGDIEIVNPKSRVPSPAQRRKILRRDGYCCSVPGCPNSLWLEVHHIVFFADGGLTRPDNLLTLCSKCHKNVHEGRLTIQGHAPHGAIFLNEFGQNIRQERTLDTAFWLDIWCGWRGGEAATRYNRARAAPTASGLGKAA